MKKHLYSFINWYFSNKSLPHWCLLIIDSMIVLIAGYMSMFFTRPEAFQSIPVFMANTHGLFVNVFIYAIFFVVFRTYRGIIRFSTAHDLHYIFLASMSGAASAYVLSHVIKLLGITEHLILPNFYGQLIIFTMATLAMFTVRLCVKSMYEYTRTSARKTNILIYGVLEGGISLAKNILNQETTNYSLCGFITPQGDFLGQQILGATVYASSPELAKVIEDNDVKLFFVSPTQIEPFRDDLTLINILTEHNVNIMVYRDAEQWDGKSALTHDRMRNVQIEDLLPRDKIEVDMRAIGRNLTGKCILITGAAGSIGGEMVRQIAKFGPSNMVLIDQAETPMHDVRLYMAKNYPDMPCLTIVGSITNQEFMETIFSEHKPEYVLHAAAYKHVPMMEDNPAMAVQNNIVGTRIIADLAVKYGTKKFVMISTDKAVNPTNVMGCSKRICEIYCQSLNQAIVDGKVKGVTQFVTTRFGNVLGSNGSVIPLFREQIRNGGPITVTHPDIVRYFMLIPEACKLVLEAGTMGHGGEIFVFDMGKPVRIVDLARRMIRLSGATNIQIVFTGLRDGEKLYEEVLSDAENTIPTAHPKIMTAKVREYDYSVALENEQRLTEASYTFQDMEIVRIMKEIVPEFRSNKSKYEVLDTPLEN